MPPTNHSWSQPRVKHQGSRWFAASVKGYGVRRLTPNPPTQKIHSHSLNDSQWLSSTTAIVYICNCVFFCVCVCACVCPCVIWWVNISGSGAVCWWKECKNREITATLERKSWRRRGVRAGWPWTPILPSSRRFVHLSLSLSLYLYPSLCPWLARRFVQPTSTKWSLLSGRQRRWPGGYRFRRVTGKLVGRLESWIGRESLEGGHLICFVSGYLL